MSIALAMMTVLWPTPWQNDDLATSLRAAHADWKASSSFQSTYRYREYSGPITASDGAPADPVKSWSGEFVKRGNTIKCSQIFEADPEIVGITNNPNGQFQPDDRSRVNNLSWIAAYDDDVEVRYNIAWNGNFDRAVYTHRDELAQGMGDTPCFRTEMVTSPISPVMGCSRLLPAEPSQTSELTIVSQDDARVTLASQSEDDHGYTGRYEVVFWMEPAVPVVESAKVTMSSGASENTVTVATRLSNWKECDQYMVPARIETSLTSGSNSVITRVWESDDLSGGPIPDSVLEVPIAATTRVVGLKTPPPPGVERRLKVDNVTADQVQFAETIPVPLASVPRPRWPLMVFSSACLGVLVVALVFRMRRKPIA